MVTGSCSAYWQSKLLSLSTIHYQDKSNNLPVFKFSTFPFRFKSKAMHISSLLKDRRRTPLQETCDWIEYVLRHGGARHLRPQLLDIPWYQYYLLDVIAFIVAVATTVVMSIRLACRCLCRVCCRKGDSKTKKDWKLGQIRQRRI